jgi:hypothetical protein
MEFINIDEIIAEEMKNPKFAAEYHKLDAEFEQIERDIKRDTAADNLATASNNSPQRSEVAAT